MAKSKQPPADEGGAGVPAWVMTFADLMTLLMCFFVLLLSFSEMDAAKYKQVAGSMEKAFGVQRKVKDNQIPRGVSIIAKEFSPGKPQPTLEKVLRQQTTNENQDYLELLDPKEMEKHEEVKKKIEEQNKIVNERNNFLQEQAKRLAANLSEEIQEGLLGVEILNEGILLKVREKGSFPSGTADLNLAFEKVLEKIANSLVNPNSRIVVAGHSDNIPIATQTYPSNWMLSAARASSVVQSFIKRTQIDPNRMEVRGYADTQPISDNLSVAHRNENRRVEIFISLPENTVPVESDFTSVPETATRSMEQ